MFFHLQNFITFDHQKFESGAIGFEFGSALKPMRLQSFRYNVLLFAERMAMNAILSTSSKLCASAAPVRHLFFADPDPYLELVIFY
jgi:hypothetical protein